MAWQKTVTLEQLKAKPAVHKSGRRQLALFLAGERPYAVDNRCPHEGFPLAEGTVDGNCVLTCNWHNWKFRLEDGECILGGDHVRSYPTKIENGHVFVDTSDPPHAEIQHQILRGLRKAYDERDYGRICREIARLHYNKIDPKLAVWQAISWSHDRWEFGTTHAYAAAADWLMMVKRQESTPAASEQPGCFEARIICLAEAVDHIAFDALRQREFPYTKNRKSFSAQAFIDAVENEEYDRAEALVLGGIDEGQHWSDMEPAFAAAALAHYNDFGHSVIYVCKTAQLIGIGGQDIERHLLPALARHLCYTTREDLIPEFKAYPPALNALPEMFRSRVHQNAGLTKATRLPAKAATIDDRLDADLFGLNIEQACNWVAELVANHHPLRLFDVLLLALARNLLHFDLKFGQSFDRPVSQNIGWLDFTHGITFANAVHNLCSRYPHLWGRGLLQMACFLGRNRSFVDKDLDKDPWLVEDRAAFWSECNDICFDHGLRDPIFSAHIIKTICAVKEETEVASEECQKYLLAGLNRFLHSPIKQKHARRLARQAIALVKRDFD